MGEEIVRTIPGIWIWLAPFGIGLVLFIVGLVAALIGIKRKLTITLALVGILLCVVLTPYLDHYYVKPQTQVRAETIMNQLRPTQEAYQSLFYLKESASEMGAYGEIEGRIGGGLLIIMGEIYGRIDSGRVITLVYEDNDSLIDHYTGVHRSISLPLDEVVIVTIAAEERPYLMYPEAQMFVFGEPNRNGVQTILKVKLAPGTLHLYLPAGWEIL